MSHVLTTIALPSFAGGPWCCRSIASGACDQRLARKFLSQPPGLAVVQSLSGSVLCTEVYLDDKGAGAKDVVPVEPGTYPEVACMLLSCALLCVTFARFGEVRNERLCQPMQKCGAVLVSRVLRIHGHHMHLRPTIDQVAFSLSMSIEVFLKLSEGRSIGQVACPFRRAFRARSKIAQHEGTRVKVEDACTHRGSDYDRLCRAMSSFLLLPHRSDYTSSSLLERAGHP